MKIPETTVEKIEAAVYSVPTEELEADGTLTWQQTTLVMVEAVCGHQRGIGWTYGAPVTAAVVRGELAPIAAGSDVFDTAGVHEAMRRAVRGIGRRGLVAGAISAIDLALWDLKARLLDVPLVRLAGGSPRGVPVYGSGGFTTYDDQTADRQLRGWVEEQGIPRVKIKIGQAWGNREDRDLLRIAAARASIGPLAELYVDASGAYGRKQAIRVAAACADQRVTWFEEPVSSDDVDGLRAVRDAVLPDVAAGEYAYETSDFRRLAAAGAVDCLQADATRCGGVTGWLRAAALAESFGLEVSAHGAPALHAHLGAAVPNCRHLEWFHDHVRVESLLFDGILDPADGTVRPGETGAPGNGLTFAADRAVEYRVG